MELTLNFVLELEFILFFIYFVGIEIDFVGIIDMILLLFTFIFTFIYLLACHPESGNSQEVVNITA